MPQELKEAIFDTVVRVHLETAKPVGSKLLARSQFPFDPTSPDKARDKQGQRRLAPSTIRFYLAALVADDLLEDINGTLGRVPTDTGWRRFFESHQGPAPQPRRVGSIAGFVRTMAQRLRSVFIVREGRRQFIEGLPETLAQPEFEARETVHDFINLIEEAINDVDRLSRALRQTAVLTFIGDENPLTKSDLFSLMACRQGRRTVLVLGPKRMNYPYTYQVLERLRVSI